MSVGRGEREACREGGEREAGSGCRERGERSGQWV